MLLVIESEIKACWMMVCLEQGPREGAQKRAPAFGGLFRLNTIVGSSDSAHGELIFRYSDSGSYTARISLHSVPYALAWTEASQRCRRDRHRHVDQQ